VRRRHIKLKQAARIALGIVAALAVLLAALGPISGAVQASPAFDLTAGLVAYWKLEEASGVRYDTLTGCGGSGCNLLDHASPGQASGIVGNAASFTTSGQYLNHTDHATLSTGDIDFTWAGWIWLTSKSTYMFPVRKWDPGNREYEIYYSPDADRFKMDVSADGSNTAHTITANNFGSPSTGAWHFIVAWHDSVANTLNMQVDNGTADSMSYSSGVFDGSSDLTLSAAAADGSIAGRLDEWGLWKAVLTSQQRTDLWHGGAGCTYPFTACDSLPPTATPVAFGGNLIRNWDFNAPPLLGSSEWATLNHVIQAPVSAADPMNVAHLPFGSCGPKYWDMNDSVGFGQAGGTIFQQFNWPGGPMYLNFEAVTEGYLSLGRAKVSNIDTGSEYQTQLFTNGSNAWQSFKFLLPSQSAGRYKLTFQEYGFVSPNAVAIDNVNVRTGYWGNDCPAADYHGTIPTNGTAQGTATPAATPTLAALAPGANAIRNCDFENGASSWTFNPAADLQYSGGATGPTWASLYQLTIPNFPTPLTINGNISTGFNWPGGLMYLSFFAKDGSSVAYHIRNVATGYNVNAFTGAPASSPSGWTQLFANYQSDAPGFYTIEFEVPPGMTAGIDGVGVASGQYSTGGCASASTGDQLATEAAANQTATAAESPTAGAATATANAQATDNAGRFATYQAGFNATATVNAAGTQTARPPQTQTQAARYTQTESARETATAQGTRVPTATMTPFPPSTPTATQPPPATNNVPPATLTQQAADLQATQTAQAVIALTQGEAARQTAAAAGTATAVAAATATGLANANATNQAIVQQTAIARQTQTAAAATQAQATYNAGATQTALVVEGNATHIAGATQTQAARQTQTAVAQLTANALGTSRAAATQTSLAATGDAAQIASATAHAAQTQTAAAAATTQVQATVNYYATQNARATGTSAAGATQTALVATNDATHIAGATLTAVATQNQLATEQAGETATAQAQGTLQAQSTQAVEPRPEPAPYVDCVKPTNPLWLADWMDYEVCRILTWFVWTPGNSQQVANLQTGLNSYEPLGTLQELTDARAEVQVQLNQYDWARTGLQQDDTLVVDIGVFFPNHVATGLLAGNLDLTPAPFDPLTFVTICTLKVGDIFGQAVAEGLCASINWMIAIGLMGWVQFLFDVAVWLAFLRYAWNLVTVTLPTLL